MKTIFALMDDRAQSALTGVLLLPLQRFVRFTLHIFLLLSISSPIIMWPLQANADDSQPCYKVALDSSTGPQIEALQRFGDKLFEELGACYEYRAVNQTRFIQMASNGDLDAVLAITESGLKHLSHQMVGVKPAIFQFSASIAWVSGQDSPTGILELRDKIVGVPLGAHKVQREVEELGGQAIWITGTSDYLGLLKGGRVYAIISFTSEIKDLSKLDPSIKMRKWSETNCYIALHIRHSDKIPGFGAAIRKVAETPSYRQLEEIPGVTLLLNGHSK